MKIKLRNKILISTKKSDVASQLLMLYLLESFFLTVSRYLLSQSGIYGFFRELALFTVTMIPIAYFILNIRVIKEYKYQRFLILFVLISLLFLISYFLHPENAYFFIRETYGIVRVFRPDCAIYAFLFFCLLDEPENILDVLRKYAYIDFAFRIVFSLLPALINGYWVDLNYKGAEVHYSYNLSFGYAIMFPTIIFMYLYIKEKKNRHLILSLIGFYFALTQGSRGSVLVGIIFIGLMVINGILNSSDTTNKVLKLIGMSIGIIAVMLTGEYILTYIAMLLSEAGVESRTLNLLIQGEVTDGTGRNLIWASVLSAISQGGILGYGAFGDRPFVYPLHNAAYSHNIFLEMICSFGVFGVIIIICMAVTTVRMIFFCRDARWRELFMILFAISCQLLLSMSFWYVWQFWAAAAVAYKYKLYKNTL